MTAIDFYKFIHENEIEFRWDINENGDRDVIMFPSIHHLEELNKLLSDTDFDDSGIPCRMKDGYFCFWASDILNNYNIELKEIFGVDKEHEEFLKLNQ